jgi:DNA-binding response OmpR family regulator
VGAEPRTVLVVDDDPDLAFLVGELLRRNHFAVIVEHDGRGALRAVFDRRPDLVVLDLGLPDVDGLQVLERVRDLSDLPVLLLTARDRDADKVDGFGRGADDYLTKPFSNAELVARVHALLRRAPGGRPDRASSYSDDRIAIDFVAHTVVADGRAVDLTPTDWRLLVALVRHRGQVLSHDDLLELAWNDPQGLGPSRVKYAVLRLRQRLGWDDVTVSPIEAVRGFGYRYRSPGD